MNRIPKPITCRWCESPFPTEEARKAHSAGCPVKLKVQHAERQAGRAFTWNEIVSVRDRAQPAIPPQ